MTPIGEAAGDNAPVSLGRVLIGGALSAVVASAAAVATGVPAHADATVTVQGTAFPDPARAQLGYVGCDDLFHRGGDTLTPMIGPGPGGSVLGSRSLGFDLAGGSAAVAVYTVPSVLSTTVASLSVRADARASGVSYVGYQAPADAGTDLIWLGRADLSTPGGAWQSVSAVGRAYTWRQYSQTTSALVATAPGGPATVAEFAAAHGGDGPGLYSLGFGCDGTPFRMDALRVGTPGFVTTYDVEGLRTSVTIGVDSPAGAARTAPGAPVRLTGRLATGTGDQLPFATMVLEQRRAGGGRWTQAAVAQVDGSTVTATVRPEEDTEYRWRFVDRPLAEGSVSGTVLVRVADGTGTQPSEQPSQGPTQQPSQQPSEQASDQPSEQQSQQAEQQAPAQAEPSEQPAQPQSPESQQQSQEPSAAPSQAPSEVPSSAASQAQETPAEAASSAAAEPASTPAT